MLIIYSKVSETSLENDKSRQQFASFIQTKIRDFLLKNEGCGLELAIIELFEEKCTQKKLLRRTKYKFPKVSLLHSCLQYSAMGCFRIM